jgi:hypothetical protein
MFSSAVQLDTETLENDNYWTDRRTGGERRPSTITTQHTAVSLHTNWAETYRLVVMQLRSRATYWKHFINLGP